MKRWVFLALAFSSAATVHAQDANTSGFSGDACLVSDYLFRGLSQTNGGPALQADLEYTPFGNLYVGAWASNIRWLANESTPTRRVSSNVEIDAYADMRGTFDHDWSYDAGFYTYNYPGTYPPGFTSPDTQEGFASVSWKNLSLKYSLTVGNLFGIAHSDGSGYLEAAWSDEFVPGWTFKTHVAHQTVANNAGYSYWDWKLGVMRSLKRGWSISLAYYATNANRALYTNAQGLYLGRATAVLTIDKTF